MFENKSKPKQNRRKERKTKQTNRHAHTSEYKVSPRFELGSLDSESRVLTITPWNYMLHDKHLAVLH